MKSHTLHLVAALALTSSALAGVDAGPFTIGATIAERSFADPSVVQAYDLGVDAGALARLERAGRFGFPLPGRAALTIVADELSSDFGVRTIRAVIEGQPRGEAKFVVSAGTVSGVVRTPDFGTWLVRPAHGGHMLLEVDAARLPGCGGALQSPALPGPARAQGGEICEDGSRIDVLILYTSAARVDAGGKAAIESEIDLAVVNANEAYEGSAIGFRIRPVGIREIEYPEFGDTLLHLNHLTDDGDGFLDEVHALRDELSADLVALIVASGENCGAAWIMRENSTSSANRGFSVTIWYCAAVPRIFAHELGHNMGACHAVGDIGGFGGCSNGGLFEYSSGHRYVGESGLLWRTVMAYQPGALLRNFSNPDIESDGRPTGIADQADNARTLNETALAIANYRRPPCPGNARDDCVVDDADILKVLANWGIGGGPSDVNEDGTVGFADILFVLAHWGPCVYD